MKKLNNKGFTLVELIIVIAIMVILVVVIAPQYTRFVNNSRVSGDVQTAQTMATAIDAAVAEGETPFSGSNVDWAHVPGGNVTATPASKLNGYHFEITGTNDLGVSLITITDGTHTWECYPNPDDTDGINTNLRR